MKNLIFLMLLFVAVSCSVVKKSEKATKVVSDSASVVKQDSVTVVKFDSSGKRKESGDYEKTTTYEYAPIIEYRSVPGVQGRIDTVIQYVPRIMKVYEKGNYKNEESAVKILYDSSEVKKEDSTFVSIEKNALTKTKVSSRFPFWLVIVLVAIMLIAAIIFYLRNLK